MGRAHGKRYRAEVEKVPEAPVPIAEAVGLLKSFDQAKFDQTVELHLWLGIDPRQADQVIRGSISLPNGIGKAKKVIAFCEGELAEQAKEAGAVEAGGDELVKKVQDGWMDFDVAIAVPQMMRTVSRLGRVLGPQGKMPSPKSGTVVDDVPAAVREFAAGKVEFRNDEGGNLHVPVGKLSFEADKLRENIQHFIGQVRAMRPTTTKGAYIRRASLAATMTPGIDLAVEARVTT
jgi:large subunit ribosomal protein L1